jgi:hypothetical protein
VTHNVHVRLDDERQQRLHRLLGGGGPVTPPTLRARLAQTRPRPRRSPRPVARMVATGAAAALAALAVAFVLVLVHGSSHGPTVADAAQPSSLPAMAPAPPRDAGHPALLRASFAGVSYPYWKRQFGWRPTGRRADTVDGRRTETVFYQHTHHRIGYTVVDGAPLKPPAGAQRLVVNGLEIRAYKDGARDVITFRRSGHTCVLAGMVHRRSTLLKLASWKGDGAIAF